MLQVQHHETVGVLFGAGDTNAVAATARCCIGRIGFDGHDTIVHIDQAITLGGALIHVVDIAIGWIVIGKKGHQIEEVVAGVVIGKSVLGHGERNQSTAKPKRGRKVHVGQTVRNDLNENEAKGV